MKITGIILAGGASTRMGGFPKALLELEGQTFLSRLAKLCAPICSEIVVVVGRHAQQIRDRAPARLRVVENQDWEHGQLSSLQTGLRNAPVCDAFLFTPVDIPRVQAATLDWLARAMEHASTFVVPQHHGRHGHPVLFRSNLANEFLDLDSTASARKIVHRHTSTTVYVDVDDAGILTDIDSPADYRAIAGAIA